MGLEPAAGQGSIGQDPADQGRELLEPMSVHAARRSALIELEEQTLIELL
jgi:hypothetical protein